MAQYDSFGSYLEFIRKEKGRSLRETARAIDVTATFYSKVERGLKAPLTAERIEAVARFLLLTDEEKDRLYDLAANWKGELSLPEDCAEYAKQIPSAVDALRVARGMGMGESEWAQMVEDLKRRSGRS